MLDTPINRPIDPALERRREIFANVKGESDAPWLTRADQVFASLAVVSLLPANTALRAQVQKAVGSAVQRQIRNIEDALVEFPPGATARGQETAQQVTLAERMAALHVPGVSVAAINDGAIEWSRRQLRALSDLKRAHERALARDAHALRLCLHFLYSQ